MTVLAATLTLLLGCAVIVYAADLPGMRLWFKGQETNAAVQLEGEG